MSLKSMFSARDMTLGSPAKRILEFSIPMLLGNIAQQLYSTVDSIVVGKYVGDNALAAVGSATPILNLLASSIGLSEKQLLKADLWYDFAEQFSDQIDGSDDGWRGEYWGKMMRGGCFVYSYTKNKKLLEILTDTGCDAVYRNKILKEGIIWGLILTENYRKLHC